MFITWFLSDDPATDQVTPTLAQRTGPTVTEPTRTSFGSTIVEQGLAQPIGGDVALT